MFRLGINRIAARNLRAFVTGSTQGAAQTADSGLKSMLAQKIVENQKRVEEFRTNQGSKVIGEVTVEQAHADGQEVHNLEGEASRALRELERSFARFESRCQLSEKVDVKSFVRIFDHFTQLAAKLESSVHLAVWAGVLVRSCGRLMTDTPAETREKLAANVWHFIKEKNIPVDTSLYNSLIKVMNENHTTIDPQKLLDEMKALNLEPDMITYQRLIHQYCIQGNITAATSMLEVMKDKNMDMTEVTFASLIIGYSMQENPPSISEIFELMRTNGIEPESRSYAASITAQVRLFKKDADKAIKELEKIYTMIKEEDIHFSVYETAELLRDLTPLTEHEIVTKLVDYLIKAAPRNYRARDNLSFVLFDMGRPEEASTLFWSQGAPRRNRASPNSGISYIKTIATNKNVPVEFAISECSKLTESGMNSSAFHNLYYFAASAGNLDTVRAALKKIGEIETLKCHYFWPLLAQAQNNDEVIKVLKEDLNPKMNYYGLMETFSNWVWPKFANDPGKLFEINNKELNYASGMIVASFLDYCVANEKIEDAVKFISEIPAAEASVKEARSDGDVDQEDVESPSEPNQSLKFDKNYLLGRLLTQVAAQTKDPAMVDKAFALFQVPNTRLSTKMFNPLIKVRLEDCNDFQGALECFLGVAEKYNITPYKLELMIRCLENKDPDSLQKIMDATSKLYGEANTLFDLAHACIKCGKMRQANKVLTSPGFRVSPKRVYTACMNLSRTQRFDILENFVHATKHLPDVDHDYLYEILLGTYEKCGVQERALDLWNRMQEDDFQPSLKIQAHIARTLESKKITVPFQIVKTNPRLVNER